MLNKKILTFKKIGIRNKKEKNLIFAIEKNYFLTAASII